MKKVYFLPLFVVFFFIKPSFSQTSYWDTLSYYPLQANETYMRNFNPINYDVDVLRNCVLDCINYARDINPQGRAGKLKFNEDLDSAALIQSEYMAYKQERTTENKGIHKNTYRRVKAYGGTQFVDEVVSRTKASNPREHYSYLEVAQTMLRPILNNRRNSLILLDKKHSYVGIGHSFDEFYRSIYFSIVLGNDKTFNPSALRRRELATPFTTKKYGLKALDTRKCRRCEAQKYLEKWHNYIKIENDEVIFEFDNIRNLKRVIGRKKDGLAIEFVTREQYKCGDDNILDNNRVNRGHMLKRLYIGKIEKKNLITERRSRQLKLVVGEVPDEVVGDYEVNLLVIKEKSVCRVLQKHYVEKSPVEHIEKLRFIADTVSIASGFYKPVPEKAVLEFTIPFEKNKHDYKTEDIEPFIKALNEPKFDIDNLEITAYTSLEGSDASNTDLQKKRAESIVRAIIQRQKQKLTYDTKTSDSWEFFKKDALNSKHPELATMSHEEAKRQLKGKVLKDMEPILAKHRFAKIKMNITYDISGRFEQEFVESKFNRAIASGDLALAMSVQKYIIKACEEGRYSRSIVNAMKIPEEEKYLPFLINKNYIANIIEDRVTKSMAQEAEKNYKLNPKNEFALFAKTVSDVVEADIKNEADINNIQSNVDRVYSLKHVPEAKADALNLELQFKIIDYADTSASASMETLLEATYEKIKTIVNVESNTWMNAYKLANIFIDHGDYPYAEYLMAPFIDSKKISDDFLFTYFSLWSYREELYLGSKFAELAQRCFETDRVRFCTIMDKFSFQVLENLEVKKLYCKECK
ncbi:MAG: CAP domain-containing protein [Bacteroidales bacterium]